MEYKPFDLEAAKRGEKVLILNRNEELVSHEIAEILESRQFDRLVVFHQDGNAWREFHKDGSHCYGLRLVMAPKPKKQVTRWMNVYRGFGGFYATSVLYETEETAKACGLSRAIGLSAIATVPVAFEVEE